MVVQFISTFGKVLKSGLDNDEVDALARLSVPCVLSARSFAVCNASWFRLSAAA